MRALGSLALVAAAAVAVVAASRPPTAGAAPADYVGAAACGGCHAKELAVWEQSAHARASAKAVLGKRADDGRCLVCHATGDGAAPGVLFPGVQCEACHGGGAAYAESDDVMRDLPLARALGLRDLAGEAALAAACARCHRPGAATRAAPFDAAKAWQKIRH